MLDWLLRHSPTPGAATIEGIISDAECGLAISQSASAEALGAALAVHGKLNASTRRAIGAA